MIVGVSIVKQVAFRDSIQEFSNTYHYDFGPISSINQSGGNDVIDRLTTLEKGIHSSLVTFVRGLIWSAGGTSSQNSLISEKALSGQGTATADTAQDKERAFLVYWDAGLDSRNHPVKLRKWFHTCGAFGSAAPAPTSTVTANATGFTQSVRDAIATASNPFNPLTVTGFLNDGTLCSENGRHGDTGAHSHKYFEHHQLGDMWR